MLTIVWDVDDVLNESMRIWFEEIWKPSHLDSQFSYSDITENPPDRVLGISRAEYLSSLDVFRLSEQARNMRPNPAILEWLRSSGADYRHMALTARPLDSASVAAEWLFRHFGTHIRAFGVAPARLAVGAPAYDRNKADFLRWLGSADVLVDDIEENLQAASELGIRGVLYPQPWNRSSQSVSEVLESLAELAEAR